VKILVAAGAKRFHGFVSSYPILRFSRVPPSIDVHVTDHPGLPLLGAGETAQGPTRAVLTNAITDATAAAFVFGTQKSKLGRIQP
jgi:CO/xanthine dehydrogenase Mo-binding subunit